MAELAAGEAATRELKVAEANCTQRGEHQIFSTPELVLLLELTAIDALAPSVGADRSSVGSNVNVAHCAPTLLGQTIRCTATVKEIDRRRVLFDIEARDEIDVMGSNTHERASSSIWASSAPGSPKRRQQPQRWCEA